MKTIKINSRVFTWDDTIKVGDFVTMADKGYFQLKRIEVRTDQNDYLWQVPIFHAEKVFTSTGKPHSGVRTSCFANRVGKAEAFLVSEIERHERQLKALKQIKETMTPR